jgi:hypothetical protein
VPIILPVHIITASLGLVAGFVALYAAKGAPVHRKFGMVFVCAMLTMTSTGIVIAAVRGAAPALNIPAGLITAYLVTAGLTTLRPSTVRSPWLDRGGMLVAFGVGLTCLAFGLEAVANGGTRQGMPAFPFFLFGFAGVFGTVGDLRRMRSGALSGPSRMARHLWRMSFALFIAALSFFIGQADVIPKPIRIMPLLAIPPFLVLGTMLYWLRRVRFRRARPNPVLVSALGAAGAEPR